MRCAECAFVPESKFKCVRVRSSDIFEERYRPFDSSSTERSLKEFLNSLVPEQQADPGWRISSPGNSWMRNSVQFRARQTTFVSGFDTVRQVGHHGFAMDQSKKQFFLSRDTPSASGRAPNRFLIGLS